MTQFQTMKFAKARFKVNKNEGYFPYFQFTLRQRIKKKLAVNVAVVGEAGISKSYIAWTLCLLLRPTFTVNQIVYTYAEYMKQLLKLPIGHPMMFDEPSYAMGKRDWYRQLNKVLVQTIESQRFKVHPLFIPIINMNLLDKTIRDHLIQFVVHAIARGRANVYRLYASQWEEKTYHPYLCSLHYPIIGKCQKDSCIGCRQLEKCNEFRAQYERKKETIQDERYEQAATEANVMESRAMTDDQLEKLAYKHKAEIVNENGKIDPKKIRLILWEKEHIKIGHSKSYNIKTALLFHYAEEFETGLDT